MRKLYQSLLLALVSEQALAGRDLVGGIKATESWIKSIVIALAPIIFISVGVYYMRNSQIGKEKFEGAIVGLIIAVAGGTIAAVVYSFFG